MSVNDRTKFLTLNLSRHEVIKALLFFFYFFCVIAAFWTLKPMRTSGVVKAFGTDYYPLIKQGILIVIPGVLTIYSFLLTRLSRLRLVLTITSFFMTLSWVFWFFFQAYLNDWVKLVFYYYVDVYITVNVTLFWTYLNDCYAPGQAKRFYGFIGTGGLLGGIVGTSISGWASHFFGDHIILLTTVWLAPIFGLVMLLEKGFTSQKSRGPMATVVRPKENRSIASEFSEGVALTLRSKYMLSIVGIVALYEVVSVLVDYQFMDTITRVFASQVDMSAFQGKVFFFAQWAALAVQLLLTTFIHKKFGVLTGLLFLPTALFVGSIAFLVFPTLLVITATIGSDAGFAYSINQSSKEILYTPLDTISKYKGKAFIDMFVLRAGKTLGAGMLLLYTLWLRDRFHVSSDYLMWINIIAIGCWLMAIRYVGRHFALHAQKVHKPQGQTEVSARRPSTI